MKIFVRERTKSRQGGHNPRFRVVATEGGDIRFHADHLRKVDIETIGKELGADVIYLPARGDSGEPEGEKGQKH